MKREVEKVEKTSKARCEHGKFYALCSRSRLNCAQSYWKMHCCLQPPEVKFCHVDRTLCPILLIISGSVIEFFSLARKFSIQGRAISIHFMQSSNLTSFLVSESAFNPLMFCSRSVGGRTVFSRLSNSIPRQNLE